MVDVLDEERVVLLHFEPVAPPDGKRTDVGARPVVELLPIFECNVEGLHGGALCKPQPINLTAVERVTDIVFTAHNEIHFAR